MLHSGDVVLGGSYQANEVVVDDADAVLADRAHRQLGLAGRPDLAHQDHVERRVEGAGDLERNRHAATRETEDDQIVVVRDVEQGEVFGERRPGSRSIAEHRGSFRGRCGSGRCRRR